MDPTQPPSKLGLRGGGEGEDICCGLYEPPLSPLPPAQWTSSLLLPPCSVPTNNDTPGARDFSASSAARTAADRSPSLRPPVTQRLGFGENDGPHTLLTR